jgi:ATP-binding cassette subfamily E protein 1
MDDLKARVKIQYVDTIPKRLRGQVQKLLEARNERNVMEATCTALELNHLMSRDIDQLSGGELQRLAIAMTTISESDVYMYDEPSSYLDVKQRLRAAEVIRSVLENKTGTYVIVVEHDLAVLDYLSDFVCVLYGKPGAYGVVTMPYNVRDGINIFLAGFVPTENLRFREDGLTFKVAQSAEDTVKKGKRDSLYSYSAMTKTLQGKGHKFILHVEEGNFSDSEIIVMLGENGTGKTTFIRMLAGLMKSDEEEAGQASSIPALSVSYKPQTISPKFPGSVEALFQTKIRTSFVHPQFQTDVLKPMNLDALMDQPLSVLSGGELQRVAIVLSLGKPANIYLIDEPSAYLDSEQRIVCARVNLNVRVDV